MSPKAALSFGPIADLYNHIRPTYPGEAVTWLLGSTPKKVVDLGAGTGIFSRLLAQAGHEVIAVEPDPAMRRLIGPGITVLPGSAEDIPLPEASVDAVVAAQSYHWFDTPIAHLEIARVLRDGGTFGPIWNLRDEQVDWVGRISKIAESEAQGILHSPLPEFGNLFTQPAHGAFRHSVHHTVNSLIDLTKSRSYYLTASTAHQAEIEAEIRDLTKHFEQPFELPYLTLALRSFRVERAR